MSSATATQTPAAGTAARNLYDATDGIAVTWVDRTHVTVTHADGTTNRATWHELREAATQGNELGRLYGLMLAAAEERWLSTRPAGNAVTAWNSATGQAPLLCADHDNETGAQLAVGPYKVWPSADLVGRGYTPCSACLTGHRHA